MYQLINRMIFLASHLWTQFFFIIILATPSLVQMDAEHIHEMSKISETMQQRKS